MNRCRQRAAVTTTLLGHTSPAQLEEDLSYFRQAKPLPPQLLWEVDRSYPYPYPEPEPEPEPQTRIRTRTRTRTQTLTLTRTRTRTLALTRT